MAGNDYVRVTQNGRLQYQHRLIWESAYGPIPQGYAVHHINGDKKDNRLANLRLQLGSDHTRFHLGHLRRCSIPGCGEWQHAKGLCPRHYWAEWQRQYRRSPKGRAYYAAYEARRRPRVYGGKK